MAVWAYVGLPGAGKSYHATVEQILPALEAGRRVVTNIPLDLAGIAERCGGAATGEVVQVDSQELAAHPGETIAELMTPGSVVVLDEVWRFLPQGLTAKNVDPAWASLFAEHRHRVDVQGRSMQIVLVTQDLSQIAAFARALVERTVVVTKMTVVGARGAYRVDVYAGSVTGLKPPASKRIGESFGKYDSSVFRCYQSHTMAVGSTAKVDEKAISARGTIWGNPAVRFGLPAAAVLLGFGLWRAYAFFFPGVPAPKGQEAVVMAAPKAPMVARATNASGGVRHRVAAMMRAVNDSESRVLLDHCDGAPGRWVPWAAARCVDMAGGGVTCSWEGRRYEFHAAISACRLVDESRVGQIDWFPSHAARSREQVSVVGSAMDGTSG